MDSFWGQLSRESRAHRQARTRLASDLHKAGYRGDEVDFTGVVSAWAEERHLALLEGDVPRITSLMPLVGLPPWQLVREQVQVFRRVATILRDGKTPSELMPPSGRGLYESANEMAKVNLPIASGSALEPLARLLKAEESEDCHVLVWFSPKDDGVEYHIGNYLLGRVASSVLTPTTMDEIENARRRKYCVYAAGSLTFSSITTPFEATLTVWLP